jgi:site-specific recombinase XerD
MLESVFSRAQHVRRLRANPLGALLDRLAEFLIRRGYGTKYCRAILRAIAHFGYWLAKQHTVVTVDKVTKTSAGHFLREHLPTCSCRRTIPRDPRFTETAINHLLRMLTQDDPARSLPPATPHDTLLAEYDHFLRQTCGLAVHTCLQRLRHVRQFLERSFSNAPVNFTRLRPDFFQDYFRRHTGQLKAKSINSLADSLRHFLRFLSIAHAVDATLAQAIPHIPRWSQDRLPQALSAADLQALLDSFDTDTDTGRRDLAMVRCMCDLGLRVSEVVALTLDDIDWRHGVVKIPAGKGRRERLLPLPALLGQAIVAYLRQGRIASADRHLFLRDSGPIRTPLSCHLISGVLRRASTRVLGRSAGIGTHTLRHTAATRMRCAGHSLKGIADVLGHRCVDTTMIYVKLDIEALRAVALPWPGGQP